MLLPLIYQTKNNMKDTRKTFSNQSIEVNGTFVHFDGKLNPENSTLKVYRYRGDITLRDEAFQNFAIDNKIKTVIFI